MIEKLTKEQEAAMTSYVDKWIGIGTCTKRLDPERTKSIINNYQRLILKSDETEVVIFDNPLEAWVGVSYYSEGTPVNKLKDAVSKHFTNGDPDIEINDPVYPYQDGSFYAPIISFYDYFYNELKVDIGSELKEKYDAWRDTTELGLIFPLKGVCIVSEKPISIKLNERRQLHSENGPALEYTGYGDFTIYSLNGVNVPKWLVMTPEEHLDLKDYHKIKNADVRTEFVRKFGVERMLEGFGKKIDSFEKYNKEWWNKSEYELWDMQKVFDGVPYAPHLKMLNQTTKIWHVEAVSPSCRNLPDAVRERFGGRDFEIKSIA